MIKLNTKDMWLLCEMGKVSGKILLSSIILKLPETLPPTILLATSNIINIDDEYVSIFDFD